MDSININEASAKELLGNRFLKIIEGLEQKGVHIIQKDVKIVKKADSVAISGTLTVHIESAFRKAVSVPETESQSTVQSGE